MDGANGDELVNTLDGARDGGDYLVSVDICSVSPSAILRESSRRAAAAIEVVMEDISHRMNAWEDVMGSPG